MSIPKAALAIDACPVKGAEITRQVATVKPVNI